MTGSWFCGRRMTWDPDAQLIEQDRQAWIYEKIGGLNQAIAELTVDPAREYQVQRSQWIETGDMSALRRMLEYVR